MAVHTHLKLVVWVWVLVLALVICMVDKDFSNHNNNSNRCHLVVKEWAQEATWAWASNQWPASANNSNINNSSRGLIHLARVKDKLTCLQV